MSRRAVCIQKGRTSLTTHAPDIRYERTRLFKLKVVRGFIARRRVLRLMAVARKEEHCVEGFAALVPQLNEKVGNMQQAVIIGDRSIPPGRLTIG
jgi:hypothetical protein